MSVTTAVCPECGHWNEIDTTHLSSRYEIPCQAKHCGHLFTPVDRDAGEWLLVRFYAQLRARLRLGKEWVA